MVALSDVEAAMRPALGLMIATTAVALSGCGTVCNFARGDPDIYGGVQKDLAIIQKPCAFEPAVTGKAGLVFLGVALADVSLSAVADTLTLPLAIYLRQNERANLGETVPTGGSDKPGDRGGPAARDGPGPLDWGDSESEKAGRAAKWFARQPRAEAPPGAPRPSTPLIAVAGPPQ